MRAFIKSEEAKQIVDTIATQLRYFGAQADELISIAEANRLNNELQRAVQTPEFIKQYGEQESKRILDALQVEQNRVTEVLAGGDGLTKGEWWTSFAASLLQAFSSALGIAASTYIGVGRNKILRSSINKGKRAFDASWDNFGDNLVPGIGD